MTVAVCNRQRLYRLDLPALRRFARRAAERIGNTQTEISLVFVSDLEMAGYNAQFHRVAGPTDILTFDYGETGELIISVDHAVAQARRFHNQPSRELALYIVHGLLHLAGLKDHTPVQRRKMRVAERVTLNELQPGRILVVGKRVKEAGPGGDAV